MAGDETGLIGAQPEHRRSNLFGLAPASNQRRDDYGGPAENRIRFPVAVLQALAEAIGADRVGFRISPGNPYNGMDPGDPEATFAPFVAAANGLGLAYLHVVDMALEGLDTLAMLRSHWSGPIIANNNLTGDSAAALLESGRAEAVSFGRPTPISSRGCAAARR